MPDDKQNFIYAYDDETHQIIVIDAETGKEIQKKDDRVQPVLQHFHEQGDTSGLRKFSVWCAENCNPEIKPIQKKFFDLALKSIQQETTLEDQLEELYSESEREAVAVDSVGLRQGSAKAPGFLASRECINPDAYEGARNAARFHCLWAELNQNKEEDLAPGLEEVLEESAKNLVEQTVQSQIDYLLELIGQQQIDN